MQDRREYFRINDSVMVACKVLAEDEFKAAIHAAEADHESREHLAEVLAALDTQLERSLAQIKLESPAVAQAMDIMHRKLGFIARVSLNASGADARNQGDETLKQRQVNLSAGGVALPVDTPVEVGAKVEIELVLLPGYHYVRAYGEVIAAREPDHEAYSRHEIAVRFTFIRDGDREQIIRHIFRTQANELRAANRDEDSAVGAKALANA